MSGRAAASVTLRHIPTILASRCLALFQSGHATLLARFAP
jgi:hypothetical protein